MTDPKKPEELSEDDLSDVQGGVASKIDDEKANDRTKGLIGLEQDGVIKKEPRNGGTKTL